MKMKKMSSMKMGMKKMSSMKMGMKSSMKMGMKKMAMKKSQTAMGKRAKSSVFKGTKVKTSGGLKKSDLKKNKQGKVVSVKASNESKKRFMKSPLAKWSVALKKVYKQMGFKKFTPLKKGTSYYKAVKAEVAKMK